MPLIFRDRLTEKDIPILRQLVTATGFFTAQEVDVAVELAEDRLEKGNASDYQFLIAEEANVVAGYTCYGHITITESAYDLYWIVVAAEMQGKGIGKRLMQETEKRIKKAGATRLFAETSSQPKYLSTRQFYERSWFKEEAVIQDFYTKGDHRITYSKKL